MRHPHRIALNAGLLAALLLWAWGPPETRLSRVAPRSSGSPSVQSHPAGAVALARPTQGRRAVAPATASRERGAGGKLSGRAAVQLAPLEETRSKLEVSGARQRPATASVLRPLPPGVPQAPRGLVLDKPEEALHPRVLPAEPSGEILLAGADGAIFARHAVPQHPAAPGRVFDLELWLPAADTHVWLAHEMRDGRRSEWWPVALREDP